MTEDFGLQILPMEPTHQENIALLRDAIVDVIENYPSRISVICDGIGYNSADITIDVNGATYLISIEPLPLYGEVFDEDAL